MRSFAKQNQELIKVRGWQVSPTEIETCLLTHPAIIDTAVIGVDFQDGRGELPRAYVVLDPTMAEFTKDHEIQDYLNGRLAKYKALAGGVKRLQTIPRSSSGKIIKKVLRDRARSEISDLVESLKDRISVSESVIRVNTID